MALATIGIAHVDWIATDNRHNEPTAIAATLAIAERRLLTDPPITTPAV
jgi:hypothetical protein